MKVMVNKNQFFEDLEDLAYDSGMNMGGTWSTMRGKFEEMDITMEELEDFIDKGYGIRINC
jgi:hypothetical protein